MFSSIVVGTDGSQTARRAVEIAADIARKYDAVLHVVHAYQDPSGGIGDTEHVVVPRWKEVSESILEDALADSILAETKVAGHSVAGSPHEVLVRVAEETSADLIVVGNRGMYAPHRMADSVPMTVARSAPCHLLIAKTT